MKNNSKTLDLFNHYRRKATVKGELIKHFQFYINLNSCLSLPIPAVFRNARHNSSNLFLHCLPSHMATSHNGFCDDYFLLSPEKATLFDLFSLLFSPRLENRGFIDCPASQHQSFLLRWPIFVSVVLQKLLIWVKKPLALMGDAIEMWLNLLSANGGLFHLLLILPTGKLLAAGLTSLLT